MAGGQTPLREYAALLVEAGTLYPGVRIGRPGRSRTYWAMIGSMRALRLRYRVRLSGAHHVGDGAAILIGNHQNALDPVVVVMTEWWRVSAFTKVEMFESPGAIFFRIMGQIPLRRGDAASTEWAMQMSRHVLADGAKIGLYPEGTRSPDPGVLHRLHKRIMIPLLEANPDVPVHVVVTRYLPGSGLRRGVEVAVSPRLALDARTMTPDQLTDAVRDALVALGDLQYRDRYARDVKAERRASDAEDAAEDRG